MVPRNILHYQLGEKIGAGGMGEIYKARDTRLNRVVAIKILSAEMSVDPERRRRFLQEAQAVSALNHPNIITIYDIVTDGETQFMVVEYVDGRTLLEIIPKEGLPVPQVIRYAAQIAEAVNAAHSAGIIHRDLKPANVMVTPAGRVKVLDFGLAKVVEWATADPDSATVTLLPAPLTIEGTLLGTVNYMSPEQAEGKVLDARSDIFSFGAVLYEMLTGRSAFRGNSVISTLTAVLRDDIQPIAELAPDVPAELERIVTGCLKKNPDERFQSMQDVETALTFLQRQSDSALDRSPISGIAPARRSSGKFAIIAALVLAVAALGAGYLWMTRPRSVPPPAPVSAPQKTPSLVETQSPEVVLTNDNILDMVTAKVPTSLILSQIRSAKTNFNLSPGEVIRLTTAGVPAGVIEVMRDPFAPPPNAAPTSNAGPTPNTAGDAGASHSQAGTSVILGDGAIIHLTLAQDIPADAIEGAPVHLKVADDIRVGATLVIHKGASAAGSIVDSGKKKKLGLVGGKMTLRIDTVDTGDGQKINVRATATRHDTVAKRNIEAGVKTSKDVASPAGTEYDAWVDGPNTLSVRK